MRGKKNPKLALIFFLNSKLRKRNPTHLVRFQVATLNVKEDLRRETLISRLIDRPIRPLFVKEFKNETQVIATVLTYDHENDADIVAMIACSAALTISGIPFKGPIGAAKIGLIENEMILNPMLKILKILNLNLL